MAYAHLNSPLPGLTVSEDGDRCCGMRGDHHHAALLGMLGQDPSTFDTTSTDSFGDLIPPDSTPPIFDPTGGGFELPLPNIASPPIESMYPSSVGTEFVGNGDGTYTNIQTGQTVPYSIAQQITAATTGSATANLSTQSAQNTLIIVDPNTGATSRPAITDLTAAAQTLNAAGQLVTAAGKLTAQGQALQNGGNLYKAGAPGGLNFSGAISSLTSWFTESTLMSGIPNWGIVAGGLVALMVVPSLIPSGKKRRKK